MLFRFRKSVPPVIRPLHSDRAESCATIHAESFAHPWSPAEFETLLSSKTTLGVAAIDAASNALRGFALSRLAADEAEILTIAVHSPHRSRGIGRALMSDTLSRLADWHVRSLFLEVALFAHGIPRSRPKARLLSKTARIGRDGACAAKRPGVSAP
jgi:[ribosomal protein S18]-alanine N-acetyltransferase